MTLDIIIPALCESKNLAKLLPYLKNNSPCNNTNLIVVDSVLSDDDTEVLCKKHDTRYIKSKYAQRSLQMNEGAFNSNGEVLLFLHADVRPATDFYNQIKHAIAQDNKMGFFSYQFDSKSWLLKINASTTNKDGVFAGGGDQCHFFDRATFESLGGYSIKHKMMEDFEMMDRIRQLGIPFKIIDAPALVSARKYDHNSYLKVNIINLITFIKYRRNEDTAALRIFYKKWLG